MWRNDDRPGFRVRAWRLHLAYPDGRTLGYGAGWRKQRQTLAHAGIAGQAQARHGKRV